jgi:F0F1-type ATP synthase membrane subunit c/vacuolar-type H+-ATPase subunit K
MRMSRVLRMVLLGFRYLAASIPLISLAGVAVGVGFIFALLIFSISRNPLLSTNLIR